MHFLMVDGEGDPNTSRHYQDAMEVLFTISYTLKFMLKKGSLQIDYSVFPLEGLWWADDTVRFHGGQQGQMAMDVHGRPTGVCHNGPTRGGDPTKQAKRRNWRPSIC